MTDEEDQTVNSAVSREMVDVVRFDYSFPPFQIRQDGDDDCDVVGAVLSLVKEDERRFEVTFGLVSIALVQPRANVPFQKVGGVVFCEKPFSTKMQR